MFVDIGAKNHRRATGRQIRLPMRLAAGQYAHPALGLAADRRGSKAWAAPGWTSDRPTATCNSGHVSAISATESISARECAASDAGPPRSPIRRCRAPKVARAWIRWEYRGKVQGRAGLGGGVTAPVCYDRRPCARRVAPSARCPTIP